MKELSGKDSGSKKNPGNMGQGVWAKKHGGLNITLLIEWNQTTMQVKVDKLWVKWMNEYYVKEENIMN